MIFCFPISSKNHEKLAKHELPGFAFLQYKSRIQVHFWGPPKIVSEAHFLYRKNHEKNVFLSKFGEEKNTFSGPENVTILHWEYTHTWKNTNFLCSKRDTKWAPNTIFLSFKMVKKRFIWSNFWVFFDKTWTPKSLISSANDRFSWIDKKLLKQRFLRSLLWFF